MFITTRKLVVFLGFFVIGVFFLSTELVFFAEISFLLSFISIFYDRLSNWLKVGHAEAVKTEGYFPQDKLVEYYGNASKKITEQLAPDPKYPVDIKTLPQRSPASAKNFFSELEKIFK